MSRGRSVTVEPRPIDKPTRWRLKWRYAGGFHSVTVYSKADVRGATRAIEGLGCNVARTDPRITSMSLWRGEVAASLASGKSFADAAEAAVASRTLTAKPSSLAMYRGEIRLHMAEWHRLDVAEISRDDVQAWLVAQDARGDRPRTVARRLGLLRLVMRYSIEQGWRHDNPAASVRGRAAVARDRVAVLDHDTLGAILRATAKPMYADVWRVLVGTGLRVSELTALRVSDVSLSAATVTVQSGKSASARRVVPLAANTVATLRPYIEGKPSSSPVFVLFGRAVTRNTLGAAWRRACAVAGASDVVRIHDLRHTYATWQLNAGVPMIVVSRRLGHSKVSITIDLYGHVSAEGEALATAAVTASLDALDVAVRPKLVAVS